MALTPKENILKKIRTALLKPIAAPFLEEPQVSTYFQAQAQELEVEFAENFTKLLGTFCYCANDKELAAQLLILTQKKKVEKIVCHQPALILKMATNGFKPNYYDNLSSCHASITGCELLIARTGSIVLSSHQPHGRTTSVYAPIHICIAFTSQLVYDIGDGLQKLEEKYANNLPSLISFATGPSRTADIEKTLVVGIHGPKEVYLFLVEG